MDYMAHYEATSRMRSHGLHAHDYFEFYIHITGGSQYCVDDTVFDLNPYQMIIIPPLHMHGLVCERDLVNYERCYLYLTPETLKKCGFNKIDLCLQFESACSSKKFTQQLTEQEGKKLLELIKEIEQRGMKNIQDYNNLLEDFSSILNILNVAQRLSCEESILVKANTTNNAMYKVLYYINQNFTEEISIDKLSHQFNMSESALSHEFRKYSNKSVYEYVLYKRIIKAKELLITDSSLTQIALDCGFNDYSNFLRVFKKISNCSPKEYRNRLLKNSNG